MDLRLAAAWQPAKSTPLLHIDGDLNPLQGDGEAIRWGKIRKIAGAVYGSSSPHGRPAVLCCSAKHIVLGTETADVLVFNYEQELTVKLTPPPLQNNLYGSVTALAVSQDETCVAAGYANGHVIVWSIKSPLTPKLSVAPTMMRSNSRSVPANESHLAGSTICFIFFVGNHRSIVISADNRGLIFLHQNIKILLGNTTRSRKISGQYVQKTPTTILAATLIRQPNAPLLIVTISPTTIRGFSINPPKLHFRFSMSLDNVETNTGLAASLAYCQNTKKLAYTWGNVLKVISIDWDGNEYFVTVERMLRGAESFVYVGWFTSDLLVAVTVTQDMQFYGANLAMLDSVNILRKFPLHQDFYSAVLRDGRTPVVADAFHAAIQVQDSHVFILGRHEFEFGTFANWADCIMALLNRSKPVNAVLLALQYYTSDYDLSMIGLEKESRKEVVSRALPDIILTSMKFCLAHDIEQLPKLLAVSMQAVVASGVPLLEQLMDIISTNLTFSTMFFDFLVTFVLDGSIKKLPPNVFKELVRAKADSKVVQDIILSLDISTLDIDLAFKICEEYELEEARIFLFNVALNDFVTPLKSKSSYRYAYLSYVLTGRIYPTGEPLPDPVNAKTQVYHYVFDTDHAPLESLVQEDAASFFTALNEAFEDTDLNDDEDHGLPFSRQMILNILFDAVQNPHFDIFVARNFPKYQQYLMVTGSRLDRVLANLVDSTLPKDERELAIFSLLSVYKPANMERVLQMLHEEKFYAVLEKLYRDQGNYKKMISVAFEDPSDNVWELLQIALQEDFRGVYPLVVENLAGLIKRPRRLGRLASKYCPDFHHEVLKSSVDPNAKYEYLDEVFSLVSESSQLPPPAICNGYVTLLAERDGDRLNEVLEHTVTQPEDVNLPVVVDSLVEHRRTGALALLLCRLDRKPEALIYLKNHIRTREPNENIDGFVDRAVTICREISKSDAAGAESSWIDLLEAQVVSGYEIDASLRVLIEGPQQIAVNVISGLIPEIDGAAAVSLIEEAFSAMSSKLVALKALQAIVEADSYHDFVDGLNERLKGWSMSTNGECEGCGKKVFGLGIDADVVYRAWEAKMRGADYNKDILVIFQCQHTYHMTCMQRLTSQVKCILCFPD